MVRLAVAWGPRTLGATDAGVTDVDRAVDADGVGQTPVVCDQQQRAGERGDGLFQLFHRFDVQVVGGLVEDGQLTPRACSSARPARVRSPGDSDSAGRSARSWPSLNLASSVRVPVVSNPAASATMSAQDRSESSTARAWSISPSLAAVLVC